MHPIHRGAASRQKITSARVTREAARSHTDKKAAAAVQGMVPGRPRRQLSPVSSGRRVGEGAAVVVEFPEVGRAVGQRGWGGYGGPVDQGLPGGVTRGARGLT